MTIEIVKNVFELQQSIARRRVEPTNSAATVGIRQQQCQNPEGKPSYHEGAV